MRRKSLKVAAMVVMAGTMLQLGGCLGSGLRLFGTGLIGGAGFNLGGSLNTLLGLNTLFAAPVAP